MAKSDNFHKVRDLLLKEGWIKVMHGKHYEDTLIHPKKPVAFKDWEHINAGEAFYLVSAKDYAQIDKTTGQLNPSKSYRVYLSVYRYVGLVDWKSVIIDEANKLLIDKNNFMALNYSV